MDRPIPLGWFFGTPAQRAAARRYWLTDTAIGLRNLISHYALRLLPMDAASACGAVLGQLSARRYRESDARARALWRKLHPGGGAAAEDAALRRLWRNVGRSMAEYSVADRFWANGRIQLEGEEHLRAAVETGRPVIILGTHLGNWEMIPLTLSCLGCNPTGIYLVPDNRFEHRILVRARERSGRFAGIPARPENVGKLLRALRDGRLAIMFVDEFVRGRVQAPAFGRRIQPRANMAYAARLAKASGAILLPAYGLRLDNSVRFRVTFLPPVEPSQAPDPRVARVRTVAAINAVLEPIIAAHADQWFYALDLTLEA